MWQRNCSRASFLCCRLTSVAVVAAAEAEVPALIQPTETPLWITHGLVLSTVLGLAGFSVTLVAAPTHASVITNRGVEFAGGIPVAVSAAF